MKAFVPLAIAGIVLLSAVTDSDACACCADPGQRGLTTEPFEGYVGEEIRRVGFDGTTWPFLTACGEECVEGISVLSEAYETQVSWRGDTLTFELGGMSPDRSGTLVLTSPGKVSVFSADPTPGSQEGPVVLYKEWQVELSAQDTGSFATVQPDRHKATLVFHGRGNSCDIAESMTHWTLDVKGPGVDFRLFGELARP